MAESRKIDPARAVTKPVPVAKSHSGSSTGVVPTAEAATLPKSATPAPGADTLEAAQFTRFVERSAVTLAGEIESLEIVVNACRENEDKLSTYYAATRLAEAKFNHLVVFSVYDSYSLRSLDYLSPPDLPKAIRDQFVKLEEFCKDIAVHYGGEQNLILELFLPQGPGRAFTEVMMRLRTAVLLNKVSGSVQRWLETGSHLIYLQQRAILAEAVVAELTRKVSALETRMAGGDLATRVGALEAEVAQLRSMLTPVDPTCPPALLYRPPARGVLGCHRFWGR